MSDSLTQFDYLLNALEAAGRSDQPAERGYANKRKALFAYVRALEKSALRPMIGLGAEDVAAMRLQATALAFQWYVAKGCVGFAPDTFCYFLLRASDFGLKEGTMNGQRVRIDMRTEPDAS